MPGLRPAVLLLALGPALAGAACPNDPMAPAETLLSIQMPAVGWGQSKRLQAADLGALPSAELVQRRTVTSAGADPQAATVDQGVRYGGVLLRELLQRSVPELADRRAPRLLIVEAVATDGYRASFSWGELFNSPAGDQILVIATQGGAPLAAAEGPLALRALGDIRPGPRHVRNLCGLVGRLP